MTSVSRFVLLAVLFAGALALSHAAAVSDDDAAAIRAVVSEQLDAFARDDARRAFSLATSGIRARFGTAQAFLDMVRSDYPVVYRPQSVEFDRAVMVDGIVLQPVRMTDAQGALWLALYPMQRQAKGRWRIDGCQLAKLSGRQT